MEQGTWVFAWNYKQPHKKIHTRFLHRLDKVNPANVCVNPSSLDGYPEKITLARYDMVVPADGHGDIALIDGKKYHLVPCK